MLNHELNAFKNPQFFIHRKTIGLFSLTIILIIILIIMLFPQKAQAVKRQIVFNPVFDGVAIGYKLYYGQCEDSIVSLDLKNRTTFDVPDLEKGATYYFAATAYDRYGNESPISEVLVYRVSQTDTNLYDYKSVEDFKDTVNDNYPNKETINPKGGKFGKQIIEIGKAFVDQQWQRINFSQLFIEPVVVAKPSGLTNYDQSLIRLQHVDEHGFEIKIQKLNNSEEVQGYEHINYIVIEKGSYVLPGGIKMEASTFDTGGNNFIFNPFAGAFKEPPVVVASITSANEPNAMVGNIRNVSVDGFEYFLQQQERNSLKTIPETVSFIALEQFSGLLNQTYIEVGTTVNKVNQNIHKMPYAEPFQDTLFFFAEMQTTNKMNPVILHWQNKDLYGVELKVFGDQFNNSEFKLESENVGFIIISY